MGRAKWARMAVVGLLVVCGLPVVLARGGQARRLVFPPPPGPVPNSTPKGTEHLVGCVPSGASLVFHGPARRREIALTFDDGPWTQPPAVDFLKVLERFHVPATFFEVGSHVVQYDRGGQIERRMLADGDVIGDHTYSHPVMTALRPAEQRAQILETAAAVRSRTGFEPCLWRPPYGAQNPALVRLARSLGMVTVMWDEDPRDWALPGSRAIWQSVVAHASNGAIVLQHIGGGPRYQTLAALPTEIRQLRARGFRFVTIPQLLGLRLLYKYGR